MSVNTKDRLAADLEAIAKDAKEFLGGEGEELAERAKEIRDRLADALSAADEAIDRLKGAQPLEKLDGLVREKPYHAIGLALGIGLVIGLLLKRK
jgi:ElaB/YqjD/DUF883 family membrane-anchored ribosome-binding protein